MTNLLAWLLVCNPEDVATVLLHIPCGILNVAIACIFFLHDMEIAGASLALLFGYGFLQYQRSEARAIKDKGFPEVQGWLYGIALTAVGIFILA